MAFDLLHRHGAFLAFDEVKTGATIAYGGAVEAFGVVPDVVCLAKAIGGGLPCGAIGATEELFGPVAAIVGVPDEAAAVRAANESPFGLGAAVFTADTAR